MGRWRDGVVVPGFGFVQVEPGEEGLGEEEARAEASVLEEEEGALGRGVED